MGKKNRKRKKQDRQLAELQKQSAPEAIQAHALPFEVYPPGTLRLKDIDPDEELDGDSDYDKTLRALQEELYALQIAEWKKGGRTVFAFEGWDAAGKGGTIKRLTLLLDPRGLKVWPIAAPRDEAARQHYLWRFWTKIPEKGEMGVFDRSWYGRVLVERVEGFASPDEWGRAYAEINAFERMLTADGVRMAKFWLHIDRKTQLERFKARETDPIKNYKLGPDDWRNRARWKEYERAVQDMLDRTHRPDAPWHVIPSNDKKSARLAVLRLCVQTMRGEPPDRRRA